ncbi:HU family DNA-binding protein [uncultured Dubosiella sp.]|uniref:HU family DNA-binding protein n=1 Tax=uncultured Dubosiella sp. TaxID=1937011 RepID=UPI000ED0FAA2|nr:HU family DNA-binding protein [uncultured Dubosiella sp.]GJM57744.1 DNA-binding protein HU 1 [Erysipelotrichaceae bacterium OPF54]HAM29987.1 HU family DNA-binding protein [Erysipelotrichaceae bacterium]
MSKYVNKVSLSIVLSEEYGMKKKDAIKIIDRIFDEMSDALVNDGQVDITGFGKFVIFDRKARMGINPVSKEAMEIPASKLPKFRPSTTLKAKCNKDKEVCRD